MTLPIVLRPQAVEDLSAIWDYTAETWSGDQAETYLRALHKAFQTLADFPEMARIRHEFTPPVRVHMFRKHVIVYDASEGRLDVVRVLHQRANWAAFLAE